MATSCLLRRPVLSFRVQSSARAVQFLTRSFQSDISPEKLYPGSKVSDRWKSPASPSSGQQHPSGFNGNINMDSLKVTYSEDVKVDIRFHVGSAAWLSDQVKAVLQEKWRGRLTKDGDFVVKSNRTRSQMLNQADALQKLRHAIWEALDYDANKTYLQRSQVRC